MNPQHHPASERETLVAPRDMFRRAGQWRSSLFQVRGPRLSSRRAVVSVVAMSSVVGLCTAVAWDGSVPGWERAILEFFNAGPDIIEPLMWVIQQPGVLLFPIVVGAVIALATRRISYFVPFLLLPIYKLTIEKGLVKPLVDRSRPFTSIGPSINARGSSLLDEPSFPSGHTTTAVATGLLVAAFLPLRWRPVPVIWGLAVGVARLYYGEHNTLDVVAGAALAVIFCAGVYVVFFNRWAGDSPPGAGSTQSRPGNP